MIKILIEVSRDQQIEIEDLCVREGKTLSEYFLDLHLEKNRKNIHSNGSMEGGGQTEILKFGKKNRKNIVEKN